jgi:periplasmic protein TonB
MSPKFVAQRPRPTSHLSVRPEGEGADIRVMFSDPVTSPIRVFSGTIVHLVAIALLLLFVSFLPKKVYESILPARIEDFVYKVDPGPGGGGGGGNKSPDPPKKAELPKVVEPPKPTPVPVPEPVPVLTEPVLSLSLESVTPVDIAAPGALSSNPNASATSRGSGTGTGAGPGTGSGLGPGSGGGFGGGVYNIGNGVVSPVPIFQPKPKYTADAMRAKIQGTVVMSAVVMPDGSVTDVKIARSLDQSFGLDQEAMRTARTWKFRPGTLKGEPVAVRIQIELDFNLR